MMFHSGPSIWEPLVFLLYGSVLVPAYLLLTILGMIHVIALLTRRDTP